MSQRSHQQSNPKSSPASPVFSVGAPQRLFGRGWFHFATRPAPARTAAVGGGVDFAGSAFIFPGRDGAPLTMRHSKHASRAFNRSGFVRLVSLPHVRFIILTSYENRDFGLCYLSPCGAHRRHSAPLVPVVEPVDFRKGSPEKPLITVKPKSLSESRSSGI